MLRQILFRDICVVRISETLPKKDYATNLLESNYQKLELIKSCGNSYFDNVKHRQEVENFLS